MGTTSATGHDTGSGPGTGTATDSGPGAGTATGTGTATGSDSGTGPGTGTGSGAGTATGSGPGTGTGPATGAAMGSGSGSGAGTATGTGSRFRWTRSPFGWMVTGLVGVGLVSGLTATGPGPVPVLGAVVAVAVYWVVMRRAARRSTPEVARRGAGREVLLGSGTGLAFVLVSALLVTAFGGYSFAWAGHGFLPVVWSAVAVQTGAAVTEELMFRGLALQALEHLWGSRAAVAITGLFFGLTHLLAPGATPWSALAIALEAGIMLAAAFLWRRNIWFVAGLHFAWNTAEQLLGIPVSGHTPKGLFAVDVHGSSLLTGGGFGLETSILPVVIGVLLTARMLVLAHRRGGLRPGPRAQV